MSTEVHFDDNSKNAKAAIQKQRDIALEEAAIIIQGNCVARCPVETGHLRGSIGYITGNGHRDEGAVGSVEGRVKQGEAVVGTNVSYAAHVEYGTKYQKAQSYMRAGFDGSKAPCDAIFRRVLGADLKIGGK